MIFIGIDPGLDGGIASIEPKNRVSLEKIILHKTPVIGGRDYDIQAMRSILNEYQVIESDMFATIENQISMPGQGLTSTLQTGKGFGIWLGLLAGMSVSYQVVSARQWQSKLFTGVSGKLDTKEKSEVIAKRLFPKADFRKSDRAHVANDGLTDAACIAEYGRRTYQAGGIDPGTGVEHSPLLHAPEICGKCGKYIPGDITGCVIEK